MVQLFRRRTGSGNNVRLVRTDQRVPWENEVRLYNFHKKECYRFVPRPQQVAGIDIQDVRCFCGESLSRHVTLRDKDVDYNAELKKLVPEALLDQFVTSKWHNQAPEPWPDYTGLWIDPFKSEPTNACGKLHFSSVGDSKPSKFIRVSDKDSVDSVWNFLKDAWRIMTPRPDLVVSIVGGAKNFRLEGINREKFENGLLKIAETTQPLFVTSGFNVGIMKTVGQIMKQGQSYSIHDTRAVQNIRCLGIGPWGFVKNRQDLEKRSFGVQYGMSKWYQGDYQPIPLNPHHTHFVLVDNGHRNRFTDCGNIAEYRAKLEQKMNLESPVVLVLVEGGAGVLSDIHCSLSEDIPVVVCSGTGRAADLIAYAISRCDESGELSTHHKDKVRKQLIKLYGKTWKDPDVMEKKVDNLFQIVCDCLHHKSKITVFDIHEDQGLDFYVLAALFTGTRRKAKKEERLDLAISLNRPDLAELGLFGENDTWSVEGLHSKLQKCIIKDLDGFVRLLIQQENFHVKRFLTKARLQDIYETSLQGDTLLHRLFVRKLNYRNTRVRLTLSRVGGILRGLLDRCDRTVYRSVGTSDKDDPVKDPFLQLFIWAVLNERKTLATLFWEYVDAPVTTALLGSWMYFKMSRKLGAGDQEWIDDLLKGKRRMEELAVQTLSEVRTRYPEQAFYCVEKDTPLWGDMTCLQIASAADAKMFLSSQTCQQSLKAEWLGDVKMPLWKVLLVLPLALILPCCVNTWGRFKRPTKYESRTKKLTEFFCSPRIKFTNYIITYTVFLLLFTYLILFGVEEDVSVLEWVCGVWALSILLDECHRLACVPALSKRSLFSLWRGQLYIIYLVSVVLVLVGLGLHFVKGQTKHVQAIYSVNCVFFYLRILRFYTASEHLGPKLHIIKTTLRPLFFFSMITLVFLLAYGVPSQALMYGKREPYWGVLYDIVYVPYWQIYGELQLEDIETDEDCVKGQELNNGTSAVTSCRTYSRMVPFMLAIYLFFANVLLLNLIIAIFTKIFESVESNSVEIWKYQMYFFIKEYKRKSVLPTPFSLLEDIVRLAKHMAHCCCGICGDHHRGLEPDNVKHLRWVERQVTDRIIRKTKELEALSSNKYLYSIQKSINSLRSTLITDLDALARMSGGGASGVMASAPVTPNITRANERWSRLLPDRNSLARAKLLLSAERARKSGYDSDDHGKDRVEGPGYSDVSPDDSDSRSDSD